MTAPIAGQQDLQIPASSRKVRQARLVLQTLAYLVVPSDQQTSFNLAQYRCALMYPHIPKYTEEWSDEQTRILYDWTVNVDVPCLEAAGYTITGVPSKDVFIATYADSPFYPFEQVANEQPSTSKGGGKTIAELELACPQIPPSEILYP